MSDHTDWLTVLEHPLTEKESYLFFLCFLLFFQSLFVGIKCWDTYVNEVANPIQKDTERYWRTKLMENASTYSWSLRRESAPSQLLGSRSETPLEFQAPPRVFLPWSSKGSQPWERMLEPQGPVHDFRVHCPREDCSMCHRKWPAFVLAFREGAKFQS